MNRILELREKRANTWNMAKAFLDSKRGNDGLLSAEDTATYEKMEADVIALGKEVDRLERQRAIDDEMNQAINTAIVNTPTMNISAKIGRKSDEYKSAFWNNLRGRSTEAIRNALEVGTDDMSFGEDTQTVEMQVSTNGKRLDNLETSEGGGSGDVIGPEVSVDGKIAEFDGETGKLIVQGTKKISELVATITSVNENIPVFNGVLGQLKDIGLKLTASGNRYGVIPLIGNDGVMEVGRYIDFHNSDGDTNDYNVRLETDDTSTNLSINGSKIWHDTNFKIPAITVGRTSDKTISSTGNITVDWTSEENIDACDCLELNSSNQIVCLKAGVYEFSANLFIGGITTNRYYKAVMYFTRATEGNTSKHNYINVDDYASANFVTNTFPIVRMKMDANDYVYIYTASNDSSYTIYRSSYLSVAKIQ